MKKILCKEGYLIKKKMFSNDIINQTKKDLTVTPFNPFQMKRKIKPEEFTIFQEDDEYLCLPKFYGLKNLVNQIK